ncbi:MAG: response regulator [Lachnotalea sp.]
MYKVIAVDDEPGALTHICTIIEKKCPAYNVIGTAENGKEALELVRELQPDLVICDVKMPLMNGITLVSLIKKEFPNIFTIIISGYQDFEFAKGAIQSGVCDYILKPVIPSNIQKVLAELEVKLRQQYYQERNAIIHMLCKGRSYDNNRINQYFSYSRYYCAIIRKNGLPRRFSKSSNMEIYSDIHEIMTIYGRDEMEALYIIPQELLFEKTFEEYITRVKEEGRLENQYITMVFGKHSFPVTQLQQKVKDLYRVLDTVSVVGLDQVLNLDEEAIEKEIEFDHNSINRVLSNLEYVLQEQNYDKLKKELKRLYQNWKAEKKPQLWMEHMSRQIIYIMNRNNKEYSPLIECEYMIEDAFFYATSVDELMENLLDIMFKYMKETKSCGKVDSPEFFDLIKKHIDKNLDQNLTLQSICKTFSVSQTYMSKLFRKYENQSFNRYLTMARMLRATQLMQEDHEIFIKDVAAMVGFKDQFYFSRIFRSYMGKCPSDYLVEL